MGRSKEVGPEAGRPNGGGATDPSVSIVSRSRSGVGESPVWSVAESALYWVDITGRALRRLDPRTGDEREWSMPEIITSVGLRHDGGLIVGLRKRVCLYRPGGDLETLATIEADRPENRLNEGAVAPDGSFWVGTMYDNIAPDGSERPIEAHTGALWRVAPDGAVDRLTPNDLGIANLMAWSGDRFVTADTLADALYSHDAGGVPLAPRRPFARQAGDGLPDGGTADEEGAVWNARFGGGCLLRLDDAGAVRRRVALPATNPTSCAFGGPDLTTLFVTTATFGLAPGVRSNADGAVLAFEAGVRGCPPNRFGG